MSRPAPAGLRRRWSQSTCLRKQAAERLAVDARFPWQLLRHEFMLPAASANAIPGKSWNLPSSLPAFAPASVARLGQEPALAGNRFATDPGRARWPCHRCARRAGAVSRPVPNPAGRKRRSCLSHIGTTSVPGWHIPRPCLGQAALARRSTGGEWEAKVVPAPPSGVLLAIYP